jgi:hypothetical protein
VSNGHFFNRNANISTYRRRTCQPAGVACPKSTAYPSAKCSGDARRDLTKSQAERLLLLFGRAWRYRRRPALPGDRLTAPILLCTFMCTSPDSSQPLDTITTLKRRLSRAKSQRVASRLLSFVWMRENYEFSTPKRPWTREPRFRRRCKGRKSSRATGIQRFTSFRRRFKPPELITGS